MQYDLESLENLPTHLSIRNKKRRGKSEGYQNWRYPLELQQANSIFEGSVGKNMSDIQKRIKPMLRGERGSFKWFASHFLTKRWSWRSDPDFYVDENNILQTIKDYCKPKYKNKTKYPEQYKEYLAKKKQRKLEN